MSSRAGNTRENRVRDIVAAEGYLAMCGRCSRGPADVLAVKAGHKPRLIQVKGTAGGPYERFGPEDRQALIDAAVTAGGVPELAWWPPRTKAPKWIPVTEWPGHPSMPGLHVLGAAA